jgi:hypothetical protein
LDSGFAFCASAGVRLFRVTAPAMVEFRKSRREMDMLTLVLGSRRKVISLALKRVL